jgi:hypothetical protein
MLNNLVLLAASPVVRECRRSNRVQALTRDDTSEEKELDMLFVAA